MATQRQIAECSTCHTDNSLIIMCQSGQHIFCKDCVTTCFRSRTTAENVAAGLAAGLNCPLSDRCESHLEFGLLSDILKHIVQTTHFDSTGELRVLAVNGAVRRSSRIRCPNEECSFFFSQPEDNSFQDLFVSCPDCEKDFCLTCKNPLSSQGHLDHICPPDKSINDSDANRGLHEILTEAIAVRCPNTECRTPGQAAVLAVKEPGDCNAMRCGTCRTFFCFICCKDLGGESQEAHQAFPHNNVMTRDAPSCWLFDDEELGLTDESALKIRQLIAVTAYLTSLQISHDRKATLLQRNREVLGDLYNYLTRKEEEKKGRRCALM